MKIVIISDTHEQHERLKIPNGDILIHAGDFTNRGTPEAIVKFSVWMASLPHEFKILIAGNHEAMFAKQHYFARSLLDSSLIYLEHDQYILPNGLKVWGSPYSPIFGGHPAFQYERESEFIKDKWNDIPLDTDILITHTPPLNRLDLIPKEVFVKRKKSSENETGREGCKNLALTVARIAPKLHVFGHLHEGYGIEKHESTTYVNACMYDYHEDKVNSPHIIDWSKL